MLAPALQVLVPSWPNTFWIDLPIATASAAVFGIVSLIRRNLDLADAHEQLKEMAVEQERARFARDLHDLLGHSLTVITVKSELARRVMASDPDRAAAEVADIERLSREALADVRATVAGYRGVTLAAEISSARSALAAAGVHADLPGAVDDVPGERRELFGWVLREGVTNVVRHSDAESGPGVGLGPQPSRSSTTGPWLRRPPTAAGWPACANAWPRSAAGWTPDPSTAAASACTPRCRRDEGPA